MTATAQTAAPPLVAGIELGGTKAIALMARGREIVASQRVPTTTPDETLGALAGILAQWLEAGEAPEALGIASFGPVGLHRDRADYGHILKTPKPHWSHADIVGRFQPLFAAPVAFHTDVTGAALAEGQWGSAKGLGDYVYITIGTGLGGGIISSGQPVRGDLHPEMGHIRVRRVAGDRFAGACPFHGDCIEGLASGPAIAARAGRAAGEIAPDDPLWDVVAADLAELMTTLIVTLSPQRIIIGGGVASGQPQLLPRIRKATAERINGYLGNCDVESLASRITAPALGDDAGPLGAVALALHQQGQ